MLRSKTIQNRILVQFNISSLNVQYSHPNTAVAHTRYNKCVNQSVKQTFFPWMAHNPKTIKKVNFLGVNPFTDKNVGSRVKMSVHAPFTLHSRSFTLMFCFTWVVFASAVSERAVSICQARAGGSNTVTPCPEHMHIVYLLSSCVNTHGSQITQACSN